MDTVSNPKNPAKAKLKTSKASEPPRIVARMPSEIQAKIQQAASLIGSTLNQFMVSAAVDKANAILEQDRIINLDLEAARIVFDTIANPPQPNAALTRAMERRKDLLEDNSAR